MKIENMRYIIEVSHYKSINKASKNLYVNQQQLSRIIASVEDEIGITIFERTAKGVFLTPHEVHNYRVFNEIVKETDCLFLTMRKPNYIYAPDLIGMPLRDNIFFENGLVQNKKFSNALYSAFEGFYKDYYEKLYETTDEQ